MVSHKQSFLLLCSHSQTKYGANLRNVCPACQQNSHYFATRPDIIFPAVCKHAVVFQRFCLTFLPKSRSLFSARIYLGGEYYEKAFLCLRLLIISCSLCGWNNYHRRWPRRLGYAITLDEEFPLVPKIFPQRRLRNLLKSFKGRK